MQTKFFKSINIFQASILISITSFLSYGIGLLRDRIIAINFGTTSYTDAYNASFLIPDMIFNLFIAGALSAAFLPIFSQYLIKDKKEAFKIANTMITGGIIFIGIIALIAFIFMKQIIPFAFSSVGIEMQTNIINMTRIMLGSAIFFAISNTIGNILMSYKHFFSYAISPVLYNLGIIFGILFLESKLGIYSASIGVLIGAFLHLSIRIIDLFKTDYKYRFEFRSSHPAFKKILKLMIPKSLALIAWQINFYIFAIVGIKMIEGGLAAFHFARNIQSFAVSLFGIAFATAVFPFLTDSASKENKKEFTYHVQNTIQKTLFFTIPAMIGLMLLAKPITDLILSGGVFGASSIELTSLILFFFAFSIPFESIAQILSRSFYAMQNTLTPAIINITSMIIISFFTIFIAPVYGIQWFSIGFGIGFIFYVSISIIFLHKHLKGFKFAEFFLNLSKIIIASGVMGLILIFTQDLEKIMLNNLSHFLRILIGGFTFLLTAYLIKSPEIKAIKKLLQRR